MGQVPNRHPVYISEIASALGGTHDLAWYRGRQYWNAAGAVVYISGNAAMSEFPGITNVSPLPYNGTLYSRMDPTFGVYGFSAYGYAELGWPPYGDLGPRYTSQGYEITTMTDNWGMHGSYGFSVSMGQNYAPQNLFSAFHIPGYIWLNTSDAAFGYGDYPSGTYWQWMYSQYYMSYANYNVRLEA